MAYPAEPTEDWAFKLVGPEDGVSLVDGFNDMPTSAVSLLAIAPGSQEFAVAGPRNIAVGTLRALRTALRRKSCVDGLRFVSCANVTHLTFLANGRQLVAFKKDGEYCLIDVETLEVRATANAGSTVLSVQATPNAQEFVFSTEDGVYLVSEDGKRKVADVGMFTTRHDGSIVTSAEMDSLPEGAGAVKFMTEVENKRLFVVAEDESDNENYLAYVQTSSGWKLVEDACPPFGDVSQSFSWFQSSAPGWPSASERFCSIACCSQSTDLLLLSGSHRWILADESEKIPFTYTDEDIVSLGAGLDLADGSTVVSPIRGVGRASNLPLWLILTQDGNIVGWHVVNRGAATKGAPLEVPAPASVEDLKELKDSATHPSISDEEPVEITETDASRGDSPQQVGGFREGENEVPTEVNEQILKQESDKNLEPKNTHNVTSHGSESEPVSDSKPETEQKRDTEQKVGAEMQHKPVAKLDMAGNVDSTAKNEPIRVPESAESEESEKKRGSPSQLDSETVSTGFGVRSEAEKGQAPLPEPDSGEDETRHDSSSEEEDEANIVPKNVDQSSPQSNTIAASEKSTSAEASQDAESKGVVQEKKSSPFPTGSFGSSWGSSTWVSSGGDSKVNSLSSSFGKLTADKSSGSAGQATQSVKAFSPVARGPSRPEPSKGFAFEAKPQGSSLFTSGSDGFAKFKANALRNTASPFSEPPAADKKKEQMPSSFPANPFQGFGTSASPAQKSSLFGGKSFGMSGIGAALSDAATNSSSKAAPASKEMVPANDASEDPLQGKLQGLSADDNQDRGIDSGDAKEETSRFQSTTKETDSEIAPDAAAVPVPSIPLTFSSRSKPIADHTAGKFEATKEQVSKVNETLNELIDSTIWVGKTRSNFVEPAQALKLSEFDNLNEFDQIYGETNRLFQILDHNLQVLEHDQSYNSPKDSKNKPFDAISLWCVSDASQLGGKLDAELGPNAKSARGSGETNASAVQTLHSRVQTTTADVEDLLEELELIDAEASEEAFYLRPLSGRSLQEQIRLQRQFTHISDVLRGTREKSLLMHVEEANSLSVGNLVVALDTIESRLGMLSRRLQRLERMRDENFPSREESLGRPSSLLYLTDSRSIRDRVSETASFVRALQGRDSASIVSLVDL